MERALTTGKNLESLMDVPGKWIDRAGEHRSLDKLIFALNPGAPEVSQTYGRRDGCRSGASPAGPLHRLVRPRPHYS